MRFSKLNLKLHWPCIRPHLDRPQVREALDVGMRVWCAKHAYRDSDGNKPKWNPEYGPWAYSRNDHWWGRRAPRPNTPEWFQCQKACHWLRGWACAVAQYAFPEREWIICEGEDHSTVLSRHGRTVTLFDVLLWDNSMRAYQLAEHAGYPDMCYLLTLEQELAERRQEYRDLLCRNKQLSKLESQKIDRKAEVAERIEQHSAIADAA